MKSALRLVALDENAERLGLTRGMALADARAMIPALGVADDDPAADEALLAAIADWAERYTPLVSIQEARRTAGPTGSATRERGGPQVRQGPGEGAAGAQEDVLYLDITGCAHLFGGESELVADCVARLERQGFHARAAIADTPGAASALARFGADSISVVPPGGTAAGLKPLPLAALRLAPETAAALDRLGLKRIGQIVGAPRAPLAARFGRALTRRLDQALGSDEEAISPRRPAPVLIAERRFAEPIGLEEDVATALDSLAATLCQTMEARGLGARRLELALFRVDGVVSRIVVGTGRPLRDAGRMRALFKEKFAGLGDAFDAGYGFDMVRLAATEAAPLSATQIDLDGSGDAGGDLDGLIDRIGARLGSRAVGRLAPRDSHIPERAESFDSDNPSPEGARGEERALASDRDTIKGGTARRAVDGERVDDDTIIRPLRLFARPEPVEAIAEVPDGPPARFRWRRTLYRVARAEGPERIAAEWWRDDDLTRDYFRVEDLTGHRFWLFREGLYGRETTAPRWYLHGVFA